jgi:hypothetical protein
MSKKFKDKKYYFDMSPSKKVTITTLSNILPLNIFVFVFQKNNFFFMFFFTLNYLFLVFLDYFDMVILKIIF